MTGYDPHSSDPTVDRLTIYNGAISALADNDSDNTGQRYLLSNGDVGRRTKQIKICVIARPRSIRMEALLCLQQVGLELLGVVAGMTTKTKTSQQSTLGYRLTWCLLAASYAICTKPGGSTPGITQTESSMHGGKTQFLPRLLRAIKQSIASSMASIGRQVAAGHLPQTFLDLHRVLRRPAQPADHHLSAHHYCGVRSALMWLCFKPNANAEVTSSKSRNTSELSLNGIAVRTEDRLSKRSVIRMDGIGQKMSLLNG
ncbi:hypothetical protein FIBSPDRAFT_937491 [Athelia psychrophila]|uniref:Uncharacterized protein n=1 Tax=Athelia psychrophila TaxID=1759441 RepID=A0A166ACV7_9AGAM|nr:hypothetical protein FIBSPDRAFT_937491 [Fibularhizoctonia sp. CBS 109695]